MGVGEPLSACLMMIEWSFCRVLSAILSFLVRLSVVCNRSISSMWSCQCGHAQFAVVVRCPGRLGVVLVWCMSVVLGVL